MSKFKELAFFGFAGTLGFLADSGALYLVKDYLGLYSARLVSFFFAVIITWLVNRNLTFRSKPSNLSIFQEFIKYLGMMSIGGLINYSTYAFLIFKFEIINIYPIIAVAAGSITGMAANYAQMKYLLYKNQKTNS